MKFLFQIQAFSRISQACYEPCAFRALTLLVGRQEGHPACKKTEWWGAGVVICLELGANLHMAQLVPLPLTVTCSSKIQTGFTFLVPAHLGSPGQRAVKRCVCVIRAARTNTTITGILRELLKYNYLIQLCLFAFSALTLSVGRQEGHPACKKAE